MKYLFPIIYFGVILGILSIPVMWAYASISVCGWKGLFVECRITEIKK